jgi:hypothetical protein
MMEYRIELLTDAAVSSKVHGEGLTLKEAALNLAGDNLELFEVHFHE